MKLTVQPLRSGTWHHNKSIKGGPIENGSGLRCIVYDMAASF